MWLEYGDWHLASGRAEAAASTLSKAQAALPGCLQRRLAAADLHERTGKAEQVREQGPATAAGGIRHPQYETPAQAALGHDAAPNLL